MISLHVWLSCPYSTLSHARLSSCYWSMPAAYSNARFYLNQVSLATLAKRATGLLELVLPRLAQYEVVPATLVAQLLQIIGTTDDK